MQVTEWPTFPFPFTRRLWLHWDLLQHGHQLPLGPVPRGVASRLSSWYPMFSRRSRSILSGRGPIPRDYLTHLSEPADPRTDAAASNTDDRPRLVEFCLIRAWRTGQTKTSPLIG